jgi:hypothetical protein
VNCPVVTRYPEKGMMISLGRGMQALSMAMVIKIPVYPNVEIVDTTNRLSSVIIASIRFPTPF